MCIARDRLSQLLVTVLMPTAHLAGYIDKSCRVTSESVSQTVPNRPSNDETGSSEEDEKDAEGASASASASANEKCICILLM